MAREAAGATVPETNRFRYGPAAQTAHWLTALLVAMIWIFGLFDDDLLSPRLRDARAQFHEIAGEAVFALLFLRLTLRIVRPTPVEAGWLAIAAAVMRFALYLLLCAAPLTGIVALFAGGEALSVFGLADLASPWPKNRELAHYAGDIHVSLANALLALAGLHAATALVRHILFRDRSLEAMAPWRFYK